MKTAWQKALVLSLPFAAILMAAPVVSAHDNDSRREHRQIHSDLVDVHQDFHQTPRSRREHKRFHKQMKREHRDDDRYNYGNRYYNNYGYGDAYADRYRYGR